MAKRVLLSGILVLSLIGCESGEAERPIPGTMFSSQWVKVRKGYELLVSWSGRDTNSNVFDYSSAMTAFRYGTSGNNSDGTVYLYSLPTKGDNQPTYDVVVDPRRVCSKLSDFKVKAKTERGWVDVPIAAPSKEVEAAWGHH